MDLHRARPGNEALEALPPSAVSRRASELGRLLGGALFSGPWREKVKDVGWPATAPEAEAGFGTASDEPAGEWLGAASGEEGMVNEFTLQFDGPDMDSLSGL